MMKQLLSYIHFIGVIPAFFVATENLDNSSAIHFIFSIVFSWGLVLAEVVDKFLI